MSAESGEARANKSPARNEDSDDWPRQACEEEGHVNAGLHPTKETRDNLSNELDNLFREDRYIFENRTVKTKTTYPAFIIKNELKKELLSDEMQYILAADVDDKIEKLKQIVLRARVAAYKYAEAYDRRRNDYLIKKYDKHQTYIDELKDSLFVYTRLAKNNGLFPRSDLSVMFDNIQFGLRDLEKLVNESNAFIDSNPKTKPKDDVRLFFVLRVAEAFCIYSGRVPDFIPRARNYEPDIWLSFCEAILKISGFEDTGMKHLLERLSGKWSDAPRWPCQWSENTQERKVELTMLATKGSLIRLHQNNMPSFVMLYEYGLRDSPRGIEKM